MSIIYYPTRTLKKLGSSIDRVLAKRNPIISSGANDISAEGLDATIYSNSAWQINSISVNFSANNAKDYGWNILGGRTVVQGANDYLWFQLNTTSPKKVELPVGFYDGDALATALEDALFIQFTPVTFTVAYDELTGLFTVTPSSGTIAYLDYNNTQPIPFRQSIAGHLFGFNESSPFFDSTVVSSDEVYGLNSVTPIIAESASADTTRFNTDLITLNMDQALQITTTTAPVTVNYSVCYEEVV